MGGRARRRWREWCSGPFSGNTELNDWRIMDSFRVLVLSVTTRS
jgi:hypothetical protein